MKTQKQKIKEWLESGRGITPLTALYKFGCMSLAQRIKNLRNDGMNIKTTLYREGEKQFARYTLLD